MSAQAKNVEVLTVNEAAKLMDAIMSAPYAVVIAADDDLGWLLDDSLSAAPYAV